MTTARRPDIRRWRQAIAGWRAGFREWRRTRPFWGGLLLVIAGLELLALPLYGVLSHHAIKLVIYIGIGGVFGILIGILLIAAGVMCWLNPAQRVFYGIAGIVLGLGSFPATNLGGFFLAMLLAIIGGSLAFSWTRIESVPAAPSAPETPEVPEAPEVAELADDEAAPADDEPADDETPAPVSGEDRARSRSGSPRHRALAVATMPALLVAALLAGPAHPAQLTAATAKSGWTCVLVIICWPSSSPSPTPSPSASASASASASPGSSANPQPSVGTSSSPGASASPGASGKASPKPGSAKAKQGSAGAGLVASSASSVLTAGSATLTDFKFVAIVNMPLSNGGTQKMLEFTASSADLTDGVKLSVTQSGLTTVTSSPTLSFSGDMTLYATQLSGKLLGVPLTFTPTTIDAILLKLVNLVSGITSLTLSDVVTDQPLTSAGSLTTGALSLGF
jgi:Family of unknown function (DUF6114)